MSRDVPRTPAGRAWAAGGQSPGFAWGPQACTGLRGPVLPASCAFHLATNYVSPTSPSGPCLSPTRSCVSVLRTSTRPPAGFEAGLYPPPCPTGQTRAREAVLEQGRRLLPVPGLRSSRCISESAKCHRCVFCLLVSQGLVDTC